MAILSVLYFFPSTGGRKVSPCTYWSYFIGFPLEKSTRNTDYSIVGVSVAFWHKSVNIGTDAEVIGNSVRE